MHRTLRSWLAVGLLLPLGAGAAAGTGYGESCDAAAFEVTTVPFVATASTVGAVDDLDLGQLDDCAGGGNAFAATGQGPDLVFKLQVDRSCTLNVHLQPDDPAVDLALYVIGNCDPEFLSSTCRGVDDAGGPGAAEDVAFVADPLVAYFVVVDGFAGAAGPFTLSVTDASGGGCSLVPVRVQSFSVD